VPLVRGVIVADIFDSLTDEMKEQVADRVLEWLELNIRSADAKSFPTLVALLSYHQEDIAKAVWWIVKPGFRPVAELLASVLTSSPSSAQVDVSSMSVDVDGAELGESDLRILRDIVTAMVVKEDMRQRFEKAVSVFESLSKEERVSRIVKFISYMADRQRKAGSRQAATELLELLRRFPEPWIYILYVLRPEKRALALKVFLAVLEKSVEISKYTL